MKRAYSRAFEPPAAVVLVGVRAPLRADVVRVEAKIDTGADVCTLPIQLVERLRLPRARVVRVTGFSGRSTEATVHLADFEIDGTWVETLDVIATERAYALLGRTFLRHAVARLDGPRGVVHLDVAPRARSRRISRGKA